MTITMHRNETACHIVVNVQVVKTILGSAAAVTLLWQAVPDAHAVTSEQLLFLEVCNSKHISGSRIHVRHTQSSKQR